MLADAAAPCSSAALLGILAGYFGGWVDALLSRIIDIFLGLPFLLGAIVILTTFNATPADPRARCRSSALVVLSLVGAVAGRWPCGSCGPR